MKVCIVGAGLAGLMAAGRLRDVGHEVVLFDKGRSPGGRLATRRMAGARLDHGAQFFTVRSPEFRTHVDRWMADGVVFEWCRGFDGRTDGFPRYAAHGGMNALAKHLAHGLDVRCDSLVFSLHRASDASDGTGWEVKLDDGTGWEVKLDDGTSITSDALIVTCPLPQTFSLLVSSGVTMPEELSRTSYDKTLGLLALLDGPSAVPTPGGVQGESIFTFIADNQAKGISDAPAITLHAGPAWSDEHWDDDPVVAHDALMALAAPWIGEARVIDSQLKRWRFATPRQIWPDPHWSPDDAPTLVVAGDAFAGPKMEGAALSGLSAADALLT